ncbi:MAG: hypothetical protein C4547_13170 [Phycisphaerales bacterium]|nr:MAG: hypothetical protein C4547_13170 [Phycisphaerales bacterium]
MTMRVTGRTKRPRGSRKGAKALAAATALAGGTEAYAEAIRFENNGDFEWSVCGQSVGLDVTLPAGAQDGRPGASSFEQFRPCLDCRAPSEIRIDAPISGSLVLDECHGYGIFVHKFPLGRRIGEDPGRLEWRSAGPVYCGYYCEEWYPPSTGYIGIRFSAPDGFHYGWIHVRTSDPEQLHLEALAWGYETEPDTQIRAGDGVPPCTENEKLRLSCKPGGTRLKVIIKKAKPESFLTLRLDGNPDSDRVARVNARGKVKWVFVEVGPGEHTVEVRECGIQQQITCPP